MHTCANAYSLIRWEMNFGKLGKGIWKWEIGSAQISPQIGNVLEMYFINAQQN